MIALLWAAPVAATEADHAMIYVVRRGWHVDVGFSAADLRPPLDALAAEFPGLEYLFFGFGDEHYLEAKNHGPPVLLAALWPGRALVLATGLTASPQQAFGGEHVIALHVTDQQLRDAQAFVWNTLTQPVSHSTGPYEGSLYFPAVPKYSAAHTCNTWAAEVLAAAALPIRSSGVIFAGQLWSELRRFEKKQSSQRASTQPDQFPHGGLLPSWQITVVPEF